jgi:hypothetical protein
MPSLRISNERRLANEPTQREAIEAEQEMIRQMEAEQKAIEAMGIQ